MTGNLYRRRSKSVISGRILLILFIVFCIFCIGAVNAGSYPSTSTKSATHSSSGHDTTTSSKYFASGDLPAGHEWINQIRNPTTCVSGVKVKTGDDGLDGGYSFAVNKYSSQDLQRFQQGSAGWYGRAIHPFDALEVPLPRDSVQSSVPVTGWALDDAGTSGSTQTGDETRTSDAQSGDETGQDVVTISSEESSVTKHVEIADIVAAIRAVQDVNEDLKQGRYPDEITHSDHVMYLDKIMSVARAELQDRGAPDNVAENLAQWIATKHDEFGNFDSSVVPYSGEPNEYTTFIRFCNPERDFLSITVPSDDQMIRDISDIYYPEGAGPVYN